MREKILIVDDEAPIRLAIRKALEKENMLVSEVADGSEALEMLNYHKYNLLILDVMMKDVSGYDVLQKMRSKGDNTPVMMLSGRSDEMNQVLGLGFGADYYLTKPFHVAVLVQAAKALMRRDQVYSQSAQNEIRLGPFTVDILRMECLKDGQAIGFTGREITLFRFLMEHAGQVFTKEQLYNAVWGDSIVDENTITVYIKRIRNKIEDDPRTPKYLKTVRGIGYMLEKIS